ncbi:MAG: hypothetical protein Q9213_001449 [Squamulea squamosa]
MPRSEVKPPRVQNQGQEPTTSAVKYTKRDRYYHWIGLPPDTPKAKIKAICKELRGMKDEPETSGPVVSQELIEITCASLGCPHQSSRSAHDTIPTPLSREIAQISKKGGISAAFPFADDEADWAPYDKELRKEIFAALGRAVQKSTPAADGTKAPSSSTSRDQLAQIAVLFAACLSAAIAPEPSLNPASIDKTATPAPIQQNGNVSELLLHLALPSSEQQLKDWQALDASEVLGHIRNQTSGTSSPSKTGTLTHDSLEVPDVGIKMKPSGGDTARPGFQNWCRLRRKFPK